ncbi:MAG: NlpC/P60 family protein [Chloroflexota bacterium]
MPVSAIRQIVMSEAARLKGIPYRIVPPPDGVENLDCSLFVVTTFRRAGIPFGPGVRIAESIRQACVPIDWKALQPGDLVFFEHTYDADHAPGPDGKIATHVGISCGAGSFRMWDCHASNGEAGPPGVGETDLTLPYWQQHLLEARRPPSLNSDGGEPSQQEESSLVASGERLRVIADGVRLRANPGLTEAILTELRAETVVSAISSEVVEKDGHTWRHVQARDRQGWTAAMYLATDVPAAGAKGMRFRTTSDGVRLRDAPRLTGRILTHLNRGAMVVQRAGETPNRDEHTWIPVVLGEISGWVAADLLEPAGTIVPGTDPVPQGALSVVELYSLVRSRGANPGVDRVMVAAALTESSGSPAMVGDQGHSIGLWQMHDQGLGAGMSVAERADPQTACAAMLPHFAQVYATWSARGLVDEDLATQTYLWTERPFQYNVPGNDAEVVFRKHWRSV